MSIHRCCLAVLLLLCMQVVLAAVLDTAVFWSIAFAGTEDPWVTWALGDLAVKLALGVALLLPFRLFIGRQLAQSAA